MLAPFGQYNWISSAFQCFCNIRNDQIVSHFVFGQLFVYIRNAWLTFVWITSIGKSRYEVMFKVTLFSLLFRIYTVSDRTTLHEYDWVMTVLPCGCSGQTVHIFCICIFEYHFEVHCGNVMALVYDNHSIVSHKLFHFVTINKRLYYSNIYNTLSLQKAPLCFVPTAHRQRAFAPLGVHH